MAAGTAALEKIPPDIIDRNPENPRLIFREDELNQLLESIKAVGIEVPLTVYRDGSRFRLIDGERRWRCARKLNLSQVPVLVLPRPSRLENILMMFNIHSVRIDWDPLPTAMKLKQVQDMLAAENRPHELRDLSALTGLSPVRIRRLFELLSLPAKYRKLILSELSKPKEQRKYSEDLFLEIYKALRAVQNYTPGVFAQLTSEEFVDSMVKKYESGAARSVVSFRAISKIARGELAGVAAGDTIPTLVELVRNPKYPIETAFDESVGMAYERRDLVTRVQGLSERLSKLSGRRELDPELTEALQALRKQILRLLGTDN